MKNEKHDMSGSKLSSREIKAYFKKNPKAAGNKWIYRAVIIALNHGGAMTYAVKEIDKLKKGLHKSPEVKKALRWANESTHSTARSKFKAIVTENYSKNFQNLCIALKFNPVQQKILEKFITTGLVENQYVGRVAGKAKETKTYAASRKYTGSNESIKESLFKALKVNAQQKNILSKYLSTGRVIGKYTGSIAGTRKTTKDYAGFHGFKEAYENNLIETTIKSSIIDDSDWSGPGRIQPYIKKEAKKYNIKVTFKNGAGNDSASPDLAIFTGKDKDLIAYFNEFYDARMKTSKDLKDFGESAKTEGFRIKGQKVPYVTNVDGGWDVMKADGTMVKPFGRNGEKAARAYLKKNFKKLSENVEEAFSSTLVKKAIAMANSSKSKKDFMGVLSDIEKLKKGLTKDPKVHKALRGVKSKGGKLPGPMMKMYGPFERESLDESWLDAKKIQLKYRKEIAYIKKHNSGTGSKKEQDLLDAISSVLSNKEKGDWSDPDFADIQALELIWDNEWKRLK